MWMLRGENGGSKIIGRNEDEDTGKIETNGSCSNFHMAIVPPCALDFKRGSSGSYLSSEFSEHLYSPCSGLIASSRSLAKIWGSLRKMKSGWWSLVKCFRFRALRKIPSIFQVKDVKVVEDATKEADEGIEEEASTARVGLSELYSLTDDFYGSLQASVSLYFHLCVQLYELYHQI